MGYTPGKDYSKIAPTGCIGPDVYFSNVMATTITNKKTVYSFCNPDGYKGSAVSTFTLAENMNLYVKAAGTDVAGVDTYVKKTIGSVHTYAALDANEVAAMRQVWDPIMAAQLTTLPRSARNLRSREPRSLVSSCLGPTWRLLMPHPLRVVVPMLPVVPPPLPGTVVRL